MAGLKCTYILAGLLDDAHLFGIVKWRQTRMQGRQLICVRVCIGKTLKHQQVECISGIHLHQA